MRLFMSTAVFFRDSLLTSKGIDEFVGGETNVSELVKATVKVSCSCIEERSCPCIGQQRLRFL